MRERGLKRYLRDIDIEVNASLPMRERGLKPFRVLVLIWAAMSLPMRERGLKRLLDSGARRLYHVAPHAGAWIETEPHPR